MVLDTRVRAKKGSVLFRAPCSAREISEARPQPSGGAIREVAPLHARPRGRSARIGSFRDVSRHLFGGLSTDIGQPFP